METQYNDLKGLLATHAEIKKSTNTPGMIVCILLLLAGIVSLVAGIRVHDGSLSAPLLLLGIAWMAAALWVFFKRGNRWIYRPTGRSLRTGQIVWERAQTDHAVKAIEKGDFSLLSQAKENAMGGVRLEYAVTTDGSFGLAQIATYQGCAFAPVSDVKEFKGSQAESLARLSAH